MKKMNRKSKANFSALITGTVLALGLGAPTAWANGIDSASAAALAPSNATADQQRESRARVFGLGTNILQIPAAAFAPRGSGVSYSYYSEGYYSTVTGGDVFWAPVMLPAGALLCWLDLYHYDNDATRQLSAHLRRYTGWDAPSSVDVVVVSSSDGGYGYVPAPVGSLFFPCAHTVNNDTRYNSGAQYAVVINQSTGATLGNLRFKAVDIWWQRQISPAPGTASFGDVPTNHFAFRHIEALAAAGITSGCGGGNYCPSTAVNRAQMAVFLATALGLHYDR